MDEGAWCLSSLGSGPFALWNPDESDGEKDRHQAPTHLHIHPLSLQDGGGASGYYPIRLAKIIRMRGRARPFHSGYGQPACGVGARTVRIWPVRDPSLIFSVPFHSVATMNSVLPSAPPSIHAKPP